MSKNINIHQLQSSFMIGDSCAQFVIIFASPPSFYPVGKVDRMDIDKPFVDRMDIDKPFVDRMDIDKPFVDRMDFDKLGGSSVCGVNKGLYYICF